MSTRPFTLDDLERILLAAAGDNGIDFGAAIIDSEFDQLGYDSLALLEAGSRIEREFGITLDDSSLLDTNTPRALIKAINLQLTAAA